MACRAYCGLTGLIRPWTLPTQPLPVIGVYNYCLCTMGSKEKVDGNGGSMDDLGNALKTMEELSIFYFFAVIHHCCEIVD